MVESIAMSLLARGGVPCRVRPQWLALGPAPSARPARPASAAREMVRSGLPCGPKMTTPGRVRQILVAARLQGRGAPVKRRTRRLDDEVCHVFHDSPEERHTPPVGSDV